MGKMEKQHIEQEEVDIIKTRQLVPEGGWGWLVCLAGFTAQFTILGIQNNTGILYRSLLTEFKRSKGDTAWVFSIGLGLMFLFCPITSSLCERVGCRIVAIVGGLLGVLAFILSSFVKDLYVLYLTFGVLWGVGSSMTYLPSIMALPFWFRKRISVANGIVTAGSGFGTLAMGPLMLITVTKLGWQNSLRVLAGVVLVCTISAIFYSVPKNEEKPMKTEQKEKKPLLEFSVLKNKAFLVWCVALGVFMIGYFVPFVHLPGYAIECGVSNEQSATLVGMMSIGSTVGRLFFGKMCDHPKVNRLYVFQLAFLFIGVAHTLITLTKSYAGFVSYMVVFGVFDGCFVVLLGVLCADIVGYDKVAAGMGIQFFFMAITCTAGPPLAGWVYDLSDSYQIAFYASGACATLGACLLFLIPILMPKENAHEIHMDDSMESNQNSEQRLIKSPISSQEDNGVTLRSGAARHCTVRNSYLDKYWEQLPQRASCSSFFGPGAPFGVIPSLHLSNETLLVVERVSQV